ncbi:asparagine synthase-related protein [Halalkalibacter alkalisediminis]|uniref:asparagine synthase (glutamine-hydrolyzing) n=1 Tax=Halalkalibacter alkalisediminis TaxID=935616 RepID=A0ABV6NH67_9BACI|nr:asparagine synthase-related protein [Halalkalibacter alkalisediminis]
MSAITGLFHFNKNLVRIEQIYSLMKTFEKFPADDIQTWQKQHIFLGCHAQWITPESIGEQLPYYDYERQLAITADVIIDNRKELFEMLQVDKHQRKTIPDSQLIILAYQKWGEEVPKFLIGDFAFMIWDERKRKLFGARDFSGARTLYYYNDRSQFAFSTTVEPLFTIPHVKKKLNEGWLAEYLAIPNMVEAVDMTTTAYKAISQVPPSHSITVSDGRVTISRYSRIEVKKTLRLKSNEEYEEAFQEVFQRAVTDRLRTQGGVGSHLSGGLDSGSVVSFAGHELKKSNKQLHTFSYIPERGFEDWTHKSLLADERPYIQSTVKHVGNIKDHYLDFDGISPLSEVDDWLEIMEMPYKFFENSFWLKGIYENANQEGINILLNGARGNWSISWGSAMSYYSKLLKRFRLVQLNKELTYYTKNLRLGKTDVLPTVRDYSFPFLNQLLHKNDSYQVPSLINPTFAKQTGVFSKLKEHGLSLTGDLLKSDNAIRKRHFQQLYRWNKSGVLGTKLSLRYSLWERDPTNDIRVIRFCLSVPDSQYVQNGFDRSLIRRATKTYLPDKVRLNQQIRGIQGADVVHRMSASWNDFIEEVKDICNQQETADFLNIKAIKEAIDNLGNQPRPEYLLDPHFRILTRALIVHRFLKRNLA